ncbi:MAG: SRPBCC domain-containing protein [Chloroflexi bacterium]|nr:SRPBCC domain-containing protein [Chloroflexota bacterium]
MNSENPVGKTKGQGWEIGVRRTLPVSQTKAWQMIMDALGIPWEEGPEAPVYEKSTTFEASDGASIEIRSYEAYNLIRMRWQPRDWDFASTLQIRVIHAKTGATISIHHEWLQNAEQREQMREHWTALLDGLKESVD